MCAIQNHPKCLLPDSWLSKMVNSLGKVLTNKKYSNPLICTVVSSQENSISKNTCKTTLDSSSENYKWVSHLHKCLAGCLNFVWEMGQHFIFQNGHTHGMPSCILGPQPTIFQFGAPLFLTVKYAPSKIPKINPRGQSPLF